MTARATAPAIARLLAIVSLAIASVACGSSEHASQVDDGAGGSSPGLDAGGRDATSDTLVDAPPPTDAAVDGPITVPATTGALSLSFTATVAGQGTRISDVSIDAGSGTLTIDGTKLPAVVYEKQPFGSYTLYQTLLAAHDRIDVAWLYCQSGKLVYLYWESTHAPGMQQEAATGTCTESDTPTTPAVNFPALDFPRPLVASGYSVSGSSITIATDGRGSLVAGAGTFEVLVFDTVDCTTTCGTPGWTELHALLVDSVAHRVCFAIFYLFANATTISVEYSLSLPDLGDPITSADLVASWTGP